MESKNEQPAPDALYEKVLTAHLKEQRQGRYWNYGFKGLVFFYVVLLTMLTFKNSKNTPQEPLVLQNPHVALVNLEGTVQRKGEGIAAHTVVPALKKAFEAEHVQGIVLNIDSGGGSPVEAWDIVRELERYKTMYPEKKVHAVIRSVGGSAAYLIAAAADTVHASPMSLVGSIGVLMPSVGVTELMDKLGVEDRTLVSGPYKDLGSSTRQRRDDEQALLQERVSQFAVTFQNKVKELRGDRLKDDPLLFTGLWWTGEQAADLGLVDSLSSVDELVRELYDGVPLETYEADASIKDFLKHMRQMFHASMTESMQSALGLDTKLDASLR